VNDALVLQRLALAHRFADLPAALAHPLFGPVVSAYQRHRARIDAATRARKDRHMHIIGLTGRAGAGKDAVLQLLQERRFGIARAAFADALKNEAAAMFGVDRSLFDARDLKDVPHQALASTRCNDPGFVRYLGSLTWFPELKPRTVMQELGDYRKVTDPDYWVRRLDPAAASARTIGCRALVITDVRYLNEVEWLRRNGGVLWRVERPGLRAISGHSSETALLDVPADRTLLNEDGLELLTKRALDAFDDLTTTTHIDT
jgi:hypothetical protein